MISENEIVGITDSAMEHIKKVFEKEEDSTKGVRLAVVGGGCSGLSYKIDFGHEKEKDNILVKEGIRIFIDPKSSIYLSGVVLDYSDGLNGKGFVFQNPNAKNTCGCGESFAV